jgi:hypothetical protein
MFFHPSLRFGAVRGKRAGVSPLSCKFGVRDAATFAAASCRSSRLPLASGTAALWGQLSGAGERLVEDGIAGTETECHALVGTP